MIRQKGNKNRFFDSSYSVEEQLPRFFTVSFKEVGVGSKGEVRVVLNDNKQIGDIINDNAHHDDYYRYHDIFHYTFATLLGWSPCTRAMIKCKRKSNPLIDEIEDGARAAITEEALSMIIFNEAKRKDFFRKTNKISKTTLKIIKEMTQPFEVKVVTEEQWEQTILIAYKVFRFLITHKGGRVEFNGLRKEIFYSSLN
jgi:MazG C-terminal domain